MDGPGRPTHYQEEFAEQAYKLCLAGATNDELAEPSTWRRELSTDGCRLIASSPKPCGEAW